MLSFDAFIERFPEVPLPVSLTEESSSLFAAENDPLPDRLIEEHILPVERLFDEESDQLTEYVPCLRLAGITEYHAVVYWKASVQGYQFILATFEKGGKLIDREVIAGTYWDADIITRSVARIEEDMSVYIVSGQSTASTNEFNPDESTARELELLPDGKIIELD